MTGPDVVTDPPVLDVADETYIRVTPGALATVVADPRSWRRWWPDLQPVVTRNRGPRGQQWTVTGALDGTMEVWLEAHGEGTIVHWYLRADPRAATSARRLRRDTERRVVTWKAHMFELKDRVEAGAGLKGPPQPAESI